MHDHFIPAVTPPALDDPHAHWFLFRDGQLLMVVHAHDRLALPDPSPDAPLPTTRQHFLGTLGERACYAAEVGIDPPDEGWQALGLRATWAHLGDDLFALAGRALQVLEWERKHTYCGACGIPTEPVAGERARRCPACGLTSYPRLDPATIVLVERDGQALLARGRNFSLPFYSCLAGFVEPGESLEESVRREVWEETRIVVDDIRYVGSQPWPFPHSMMIGFTARYVDGEIQVDESELSDAQWFRATDLPKLPGRLSIARRLVDGWLCRQGVDPDTIPD